MNIGDTVYVWWYGKPVQGMIVENKEITPLLASMMVVRIPIQGVHASALFMPQHVFETEEQILFKHKDQRPAEDKNNQFELKLTDYSSKESPITAAKDAYARLIDFKNAHWDNEHNHIEVSALNDFYDLWVDYMTQRLNAMQSKEYQNKMAIQAPATPVEAWRRFHPVHKKLVFEKPKIPKAGEKVARIEEVAYFPAAKNSSVKAINSKQNPKVTQLDLFA